MGTEGYAMTTRVQQLVIRFEEPRDRNGTLMAREDWVQGVSEAALGGVRAWAAGARAVFEPTLEIEEVESRASI
jgi:hypothetical protein